MTDPAPCPRYGEPPYWAVLFAAAAWKRVAEHRAAQAEGRSRWYRDSTVRVARVEEAYDFEGLEEQLGPTSPGPPQTYPR